MCEYMAGKKSTTSEKYLLSLILFTAVAGIVLAAIGLAISQTGPHPSENYGSRYSEESPLGMIPGSDSPGNRAFLMPDDEYFSTHTPLEFLADLAKNPDQPVTILSVPEGWITHSDAEKLILLANVNAPAAPVVSALSSFYPFQESSTVGNEALYLLEGYHIGKYPPTLCSIGSFPVNRTGTLAWWEDYGKKGILDEKAAISIVQGKYPKLYAFPSSEFPVKVIQSQRDQNGWYLAFITEGSGLPIIGAECFYVGDNRTVQEIPAGNRSYNTQPDQFSPRTCS